jgi:hypothetical protein
LKITGTLDIECAEWDRFVVAAVYEPDSGTTIHRSVSTLVDHLLARPKSTWFAHGSGVYDGLAIVSEMRWRGIPTAVDLSGSRASRIVGGGIVVRDSWPLVPLKLEIAAELAGEKKTSLGLPCTCRLPCGGYCQLARAFRDERVFRRVAEKCADDARVLYAVLRAVETIGAELGLVLRGTIAGTAWATAQATLDLPDADHPPQEWRMLREAYYGGRTFIGRPRAKAGAHWDLSSAYPHALASTPVPIGSPMARTGVAARRDFANGLPGIFSASVIVPELFAPPLPVRETKRIVYPVGTVRGSWTGVELRAAMERGCVVGDIGWALVWPEEAVLFRNLITKWWRARRKAGKATARGMWLRELANSLTGKLAEGWDRRVAKIFPSEIVICQGRKPCSMYRCTGACGAYSQLDTWGEIWGVPIHRPAKSGHIAWAATLTAATRVRLLEGIESQGESIVYSHTDSIWTVGDGPKPRGSKLGQWEHKFKWWDWQCHAVGQYRYRLSPDGPLMTRTAGATITAEEFEQGEGVNDRGVLSFVEAVASTYEKNDSARSLFRRRNQNWTVSQRGKDTGWYGDRVLDTRSGITYPLDYSKHTWQGNRNGGKEAKP